MMNEKMLYIIKIISIHLIGCILCASQAYISMYEFNDQISSICIRCSYTKDVLYASFSFYFFFLFTYLLFFLFVRLLSREKKLHKVIPIMLIYVITCFVTNYDIFYTRVSSWSTFTTVDELLWTVYKSFIEVTITAVIFYLLIRRYIAQGGI
jgi:uncharacterized membrane protein